MKKLFLFPLAAIISISMASGASWEELNTKYRSAAMEELGLSYFPRENKQARDARRLEQMVDPSAIKSEEIAALLKSIDDHKREQTEVLYMLQQMSIKMATSQRQLCSIAEQMSLLVERDKAIKKELSGKERRDASVAALQKDGGDEEKKESVSEQEKELGHAREQQQAVGVSVSIDRAGEEGVPLVLSPVGNGNDNGNNEAEPLRRRRSRASSSRSEQRERGCEMAPLAAGGNGEGQGEGDQESRVREGGVSSVPVSGVASYRDQSVNNRQEVHGEGEVRGEGEVHGEGEVGDVDRAAGAADAQDPANQEPQVSEPSVNNDADTKEAHDGNNQSAARSLYDGLNIMRHVRETWNVANGGSLKFGK